MHLRLILIALAVTAMAMDEPSCGPGGPASLSGTSFEDSDGDGSQNGGETGNAGRTVFIDQSFDGILDPGEPTTTTDANGAFSFEDAPTGIWSVAEEIPFGFEQTAPSGLQLTAPQRYSGEFGARDPAIADFDLDGYPDVVVANNRSQSASVFMNEGDGTFAPAVLYTTGDRPRTALAVKLDGDEWPDIAIGNYNDNTVQIFLNQGDGTFVSDGVYPVGDSTFDMKAVDWDFDDDLDLVTVDFKGHTMTRLVNDGNGVFSTLDQTNIGLRPHSVLVKDVDEDGFLDFVVSCLSEDSVRIAFGTAGSGLEPVVGIPLGGTGPIETYLLDLDDDGQEEMVTANICYLCEQTEDISVLFRTGPRSWSAPTIYTIYPGSEDDSVHEVEFVDLNDDGELDMAVPGSASGALAILMNLGDGVFGPPTIYPVGTSFQKGLFRVASADFDFDGDHDLVTADWKDDKAVVFLNDGTGLLTLGYETEDVPSQPRFVNLVDLNNDGDEDILFVGQNSSEIAVVHNVFGARPVVVNSGSDIDGLDFGSREVVP